MENMKKNILEIIKKNKIIAILRADDKKNILKTCNVLVSSGIKLIEITLSIPSAYSIIKEISQNDEIIIGAGTVLDDKEAVKCIESGAKFIVSPIFDENIVNVCRNRNIPVSQCAATPTEIFNAYKCGVDFVKIFPAHCFGGVKFIKSLKAPLPFIKFMPSGGIDEKNIKDYLDIDVFALGIGGNIASSKDIKEGNFDLIQNNAERFKSFL